MGERGENPSERLSKKFGQFRTVIFICSQAVTSRQFNIIIKLIGLHLSICNGSLTRFLGQRFIVL